jgi:hypothetical protein
MAVSMIQHPTVAKRYNMKLSALYSALSQVTEMVFIFPDGRMVPPHFHLTEVGLVTKTFIDCGGTLRTDEIIQMQLWTANDVQHRLDPSKFKEIVRASVDKLQMPDREIFIEYQGSTIEKYGIRFSSPYFHLTRTETACLAQDACGVPTPKTEVDSTDPGKKPDTCCPPNSGCC